MSAASEASSSGSGDGASSSKLSIPIVLAFALPSFTGSLMQGPTGGMLSGIYAKYFGLSLTFIASVMLICRLIDAVTDPLIGFLSDRTRSRFGRRKPWIVAGTILTVPSVYFLFTPPDNVSGTYFFIFYSLAFLSWTMSEIPTTAWFTELTGDYSERTRIVAYRTAIALVGAMAFLAVPQLPIFETTEMTPEVLGFVALCVAVLLPVSVAIALFKVPTGDVVGMGDATGIRDLWTSLKANRPFQIFCFVFAIGGLAGGMNGALFFLYIDTYLLLGDKISLLLLPAVILTLLAMPLWLVIIKKYGKQKAWAAGAGLSILVWPIVVLLEPGPDALIPILVISSFTTLAGGAMAVAPAAMLADVIDYDVLKSGASRAGTYFAVFTLMAKANAAVGASVGLVIIDLFGYDATAKVHSANEVFGMQLGYVWIPTVLFVPAIYLIWNFPIDERRQMIIRKRIESLAARAARDGKSAREAIES